MPNSLAYVWRPVPNRTIRANDEVQQRPAVGDVKAARHACFHALLLKPPFKTDANEED